MGRNSLNLVGKKIGRWTVINKSSEYKSHDGMWLCKCECGNERVITASSLNKKLSQSCGCLKSELTSERSLIHGQSGRTSEYNIWNMMIQRCHNPNNESYPNYGQRGISVCKRWRVFDNFFMDMGVRPSYNHSIDRYPNLNGNYEPGNCRWATKLEQAGNVRTNRWFEYNGEKMILQDWSRKFGVSPDAIVRHLKRGKSFEKVFEFYTNKKATA